MRTNWILFNLHHLAIACNSALETKVASSKIIFEGGLSKVPIFNLEISALPPSFFSSDKVIKSYLIPVSLSY
jgi:hypothetical protein